MEFTKKGTFGWRIGVAFIVIGLLLMFTKEELNDTNNVLKWAMKNLSTPTST